MKFFFILGGRNHFRGHGFNHIRREGVRAVSRETEADKSLC